MDGVAFYLFTLKMKARKGIIRRKQDQHSLIKTGQENNNNSKKQMIKIITKSDIDCNTLACSIKSNVETMYTARPL